MAFALAAGFEAAGKNQDPLNSLPESPKLSEPGAVEQGERTEAGGEVAPEPEALRRATELQSRRQLRAAQWTRQVAGEKPVRSP